VPAYAQPKVKNSSTEANERRRKRPANISFNSLKSSAGAAAVRAAATSVKRLLSGRRHAIKNASGTTAKPT
jgi:hypothetical protein